jgi:hypothetical protein
MSPAARHWLFLALLGLSLAGMIAFSLWQMTVELSPEQARALATKLANQAFAEKQLLSVFDKSQPAVVLVPDVWPPPERKDGRWKFELTGGAGPQATVSFDLHGRRAEVQVSYRSE